MAGAGTLMIAIPFVGGVSIFLFALSLIPQKSPLKRQLEEMQGRNLTGPQTNRFAVLEKIFGDEGRGQLQKQLIEAGWYTVTPTQMGIRMAAGGIIGVTAGALIVILTHNHSVLFLGIAVVLGILGAYSPMVLLARAIGGRKLAVQKALPDFLDMVATTVQAGLSVNAAFGYATQAAPGPLGEEIKETLSQMRLGRSRIDALKAMGSRVNQEQLSTTISAITQADKLGANISKVLSELAEEVRNHRIMLVEEQAAQMPVKMIFPMAFCLLPALFAIIFGAVGSKLVH
ncbi:MAG: type II secretion system F family protein [Candidatus Eremiobacteraeota bacterium]|nr:type II secretion system F family protein [Candidatus Eremiobacteraeota bacterium]